MPGFNFDIDTVSQPARLGNVIARKGFKLNCMLIEAKSEGKKEKLKTKPKPKQTNSMVRKCKAATSLDFDLLFNRILWQIVRHSS